MAAPSSGATITDTNVDRKDQHHDGPYHMTIINRDRLLDLLRVAERLGPEGEGLDIDDIAPDLTLEDLAELRAQAGTFRSALDEVGRAIARTWSDRLPSPRSVAILDGGRVARLSWTKPLPRWIDGDGIAFATFMLEQEPQIVARAFSTQTKDRTTLVPSVQKGALPPGAYDTFVIIRHDDKPTPTLSVAPIEQVDTKWIHRLSEGQIGQWNSQTRRPEVYAPTDGEWVEMAKTTPTQEDST